MRRRRTDEQGQRRGVVVILIALLLIPFMAIISCVIDYGFLLQVRTELQGAADATALAAVRDLLPDADGSQTQSKLDAKATALVYSRLHSSSGLVDSNNSGPSSSGLYIDDADTTQYITGKFDPTEIYQVYNSDSDGEFPSASYPDIGLLALGTHDTVRVTIKRDGIANSQVAMFFGRMFGISQISLQASATAILQPATSLGPGAKIIPISMKLSDFIEATEDGDNVKLFTNGDVEGLSEAHWGSVDIGNTNNSNADAKDQVENGLRQEDLDALHADGSIPTADEIPVFNPDGSNFHFDAEGDTGLSAGIKNPLSDAVGNSFLMPLYDGVTDNSGAGSDSYHIVGWAVIEIVEVSLTGNPKFIEVKPSVMYGGAGLIPNPDLSDPTTNIKDAFATAVLVR